MNKYQLSEATITSRTDSQIVEVEGKRLIFIPTSLYCLNLGLVTSEMAMAARIAEGKAYEKEGL